MSPLLLTASAAAPGATGAPSGPAAFFIQMFPLLLVFVIFYFLMIRPQTRRMKAHQASIMAVKKGDRVVTGGGLIGRVTRVSDTEVEVELAPGNRVQVVKATLSQVGDGPAGATKPAND
jgi:preprotein translocase subunit YajC